MDYYVNGDPARAEEIKAAFEKLGVTSNADRYNYKNDNVLYFTAGGMIHMIDANGSWANIIKTHPDYKELELPVEPKFKVGDSLQSGSHFTKILSINLEEGRYYCDNRIISFENQDLWHLAPKPHYDIANFYAGMPVLVRDSDDFKWLYTIFGIYDKDNKIYPFVVVDMRGYAQCIPFEGNEHLLGTTDMPSDEFINW